MSCLKHWGFQATLLASGEQAAGGDAGVVDNDEIFGDNAETDEDGGEMDMNEYSGEPACCHMPDSERIPCGHQLNTSREYCEGLGCCYNPTRAGSFATTGTELPACFHHSGKYYQPATTTRVGTTGLFPLISSVDQETQ